MTARRHISEWTDDELIAAIRQSMPESDRAAILRSLDQHAERDALTTAAMAWSALSLAVLASVVVSGVAAWRQNRGGRRG